MYDNATRSAAFMTETNGNKQYWIATGTEGEVLKLVQTFKPSAARPPPA
jgi:hypothetical protein